MNKKNLLMSLFAMLIAIFSLATLTSCKDDKEEIDENGWVKTYPKSENYDKFTVTSISGEIKFNQEISKYEFVPDNSKDIREKELSWGDCGGQRMFVIISNKENDYKDFIGKVTISGYVQFLYEKVPNRENYFGEGDFFYSLNITNISKQSLAKLTRSNNVNIKYICGTSEPDCPIWLSNVYNI